MTLLYDMPMYGFDTETTGVDVTTDRIVTGTLLHTTGYDTEPKAKDWLLNPGIDIPQAATDVHGITTAHAREHGSSPAVALQEMGHLVAGIISSGQVLVAFNASYDLSILDAELARHNLPTLFDRVGHGDWFTVIDPLVLIRGVDETNRNFKKGRKYTLAACCQRFKVPLNGAHDATADATAAVALARVFLQQEWSLLGGYSPSQFFTLQQTMHREKMRGLREWFEKNGETQKAASVDLSWPVRSREAVPA